MRIAGTLLAIAGMALLYKNNLYIGILAFVLGGFLAKGLYLSVKSLGIVGGAFLVPYGYHNEFTPFIYVLLAICFVLIFFARRRIDSSGAAEWGFEFALEDMFDSDGGPFDGGDGGGGGGD